MKQIERARFRIKLRKTYQGRELKPSMELIDGKIMLFEASWLMDDDDKYPGEWVMTPVEESEDRTIMLRDVGIAWIASGDLERLGHLRGKYEHH